MSLKTFFIFLYIYLIDSQKRYNIDWKLSDIKFDGSFGYGCYIFYGNNNGYMFGGYEFESKKILNNIYKLTKNNDNKYEWTILSSITPNNLFCNSQSTINIDNFIYIIGVDQEPSKLGSIYVYNTINDEFISENEVNIPDMMYPVDRPCVVKYIDIINDMIYLYIIGGLNMEYIPLKRTQILNITGNIWINSDINNLPESRYNGACTIVSNNIYYFGGLNEYKQASDIIYNYNINIFNPDKWVINHDKLSVPRRDLRSIYYNDLILIIGGVDMPYTYNNVDIYDPKTNTIVGLNHIQFNRRSFMIGNINDNLYIFGGSYYVFNQGWIDIKYAEYTDNIEIDTYLPTSEPTLEPTSIINDITLTPTININNINTINDIITYNDTNIPGKTLVIYIILIGLLSVCCVCILILLKNYIKSENDLRKTQIQLKSFQSENPNNKFVKIELQNDVINTTFNDNNYDESFSTDLDEENALNN